MTRRALAALAVLAGCREPPAPPPVARDAGMDVAVARRRAPRLDPGVYGPWHLEGASAAVSPARWDDGVVRGAVAIPEEDLARAEMRWVEWSASGVTVLARRVVTGMIPGAAIARVPDGAAEVLVWRHPVDDGGVSWRALGVRGGDFVGDEREATAREVEAAGWIAVVTARRSRDGSQEPAWNVMESGEVLHVDTRRRVTRLKLDERVVTEGEDLLTYEGAMGLGLTSPGHGWIATSRGHCGDTRVEVFRVAGDDVWTEAVLPVGKEIGFRWVHIDAREDLAVVTWYQDVIPIRMRCTRGEGSATAQDHGAHVAVVQAAPGARDR